MPKQQILTPEEFVEQVEHALPKSTVKEQRKLLEHANAWAIYSYNGRVPSALTEHIQQLEQQCHC